MGKLIIQPTSSQSSDGCLVVGLLALALLMVVYIANAYPQAGAGAWVLLVLALGGAGALRWAQKEQGRKDQQAGEAWLAEAHNVVQHVAGQDELLPTSDVSISLGAGEVCYWQGDVVWCEYRAVTTRVQYHGPVISVPIFKGFRYRAG